MKTKFFFNAKRVLMVLIAILTIGVRYAGAATTGTITFGNGTGDLTISSGSVNGNDSQSNTWYVTVSGNGVYYAQNADYSQVGSEAKPATSIQFQMTLGSSQTVSALSFTCTGTSATRGRVTLKIGDTVIGTDSVSGSSKVTIANTGWTSGTVLTVLITNITAGFKCQTISYTYGETMRTVNWRVNGNAAGGTPTTNVPNGVKVMTLPTTPTSSDCDGSKVFVGWSASAIDGETNTRPTDLFTTAAGSPAVTGTTTYYAVFATATAGTGDWEKYTESTIAEGDYLLWSYDYVMSNTVSSSTLGGQFVSKTNDVIEYNAAWAAACTWHIAASATPGYYTFYNAAEGKYIVSTGSANQADLASSPANDKEKFSVTYHATDGSYSNTFEFTNKYNDDNNVLNDKSKKSATLRRGGSGSGAKFACYASASAYVNLYKRGNAYTAYSTDCCEQPATALSITSANTVAMGNTITLSSTGGNGGSVTWTVTPGSGNGSISAGVFTPSSAGTVTIKAHQDQRTVSETKYCAQDAEQEVTITVNVTGVEVDPTSKAIITGETFTITPTVSPADATDKTVSWSSNATGKATVNSEGMVTGVDAGNATITCTTNNGSRTATCDVTVYGVTMQAKALVDAELVDILGGNPGAPTRSGINISPAANANNYVFDHWEIANATLGSSSTTKNNTITNPTGVVTVTAVYLPGVEIKWYVNGKEWTAGDPDTSVESGTQYKDLKFPTDPTKGDACGDRFVGWTDHSMGGAPGQSEPSPLLNSGNSDTTPITTAKEFHAVFADYAN